MPAYNDGQRHFGENYVQEILEKASQARPFFHESPACGTERRTLGLQLPSDIRWHFIGHLQSNKARDIVKRVPNLWMVESLDSEKCANNLNKVRFRLEPSRSSAVLKCPPRLAFQACMEFRPDNRLKVLVQVNTSLEDGNDPKAPRSRKPTDIQEPHMREHVRACMQTRASVPFWSESVPSARSGLFPMCTRSAAHPIDQCVHCVHGPKSDPARPLRMSACRPRHCCGHQSCGRFDRFSRPCRGRFYQGTAYKDDMCDTTYNMNCRMRHDA